MSFDWFKNVIQVCIVKFISLTKIKECQMIRVKWNSNMKVDNIEWAIQYCQLFTIEKSVSSQQITNKLSFRVVHLFGSIVTFLTAYRSRWSCSQLPWLFMSLLYISWYYKYKGQVRRCYRLNCLEVVSIWNTSPFSGFSQ